MVEFHPVSQNSHGCGLNRFAKADSETTRRIAAERGTGSRRRATTRESIARPMMTPPPMMPSVATMRTGMTCSKVKEVPMISRSVYSGPKDVSNPDPKPRRSEFASTRPSSGLGAMPAPRPSAMPMPSQLTGRILDPQPGRPSSRYGIWRGLFSTNAPIRRAVAEVQRSAS